MLLSFLYLKADFIFEFILWGGVDKWYCEGLYLF